VAPALILCPTGIRVRVRVRVRLRVRLRLRVNSLEAGRGGAATAAARRCARVCRVGQGAARQPTCSYVMLCYVMVPLLPPVNCVEDSWGWRLHATSAQWGLPRGKGHGAAANLQGVAGNKKGEFEVEAQFLSKLHTNDDKILLKLLLKGTKNEAHFLKVTVSYCTRPPVLLVSLCPSECGRRPRVIVSII
jgi:hypothetical protein